VPAGDELLPLAERGGATATEVMVTASGLLKAANLAVFELGMWQELDRPLSGRCMHKGVNERSGDEPWTSLLNAVDAYRVDELNTTREAARRGFPGTHAETGPSCYDAVRIERRCYGARCL
jgi:hypothetical protein